MISDAERRRLDEIEKLMRIDDPAFVRRFDRRTHPPRDARAVARASILAAFAIVVVSAVIAVAAALGGAVAAEMVMWIMTTLWVGVVLWRRRAHQPRRWS